MGDGQAAAGEGYARADRLVRLGFYGDQRGCGVPAVDDGVGAEAALQRGRLAGGVYAVETCD